MKIVGFILFMILLHFSGAQGVTNGGTSDVFAASYKFWDSHGNITFDSGDGSSDYFSSLLYVGEVSGGSLVLCGKGQSSDSKGTLFVVVIDTEGKVTLKGQQEGEFPFPKGSYFGANGAVIQRSDGVKSAIFNTRLGEDNFTIFTFDEDGGIINTSDVSIFGNNISDYPYYISSFQQDTIVIAHTTDGSETNFTMVETQNYTILNSFVLSLTIKSISCYNGVLYANTEYNIYAINITSNESYQAIEYSFSENVNLGRISTIDNIDTPALLLNHDSINAFYWVELPVNRTLYFDELNSYKPTSENYYGSCAAATKNNTVLISTENGFSSLTINGYVEKAAEIITVSSTVFTSLSSTYESTDTISSIETTTTSAETTTIIQGNTDTTTSISQETMTLITTSISQETMTFVSNSISTTSKEMDSTSNPCEIFGGSNCNSNSEGTDGGITIGDTDDTEPEVITIGGEGEDISIGGDISTGQINITLSGNLTIGGTLNVGGGTTIVFSKGTITAECVYFEDGSFIQVDLTAEEKKQLAENDESVVLINSECVDGEEQFTERTSDCQNGVQESYNYDNGQLSASFSTCIEPGYIILIMAIIIAVVAGFVCLVFFTPLQKVIFPHRQEENKRDSIVRDERLMDRLTVLDTELKQIQKRTDDLDKEIAELESNEMSSSA